MTPGLRIGRYEVGERLGKGGFGVVHLARDVELDRDVAIKFLKPEYSTREQVVQRFLQEARAAAKIGHAGIVMVFECGFVSGTGGRRDGTAYIVMERLSGESLSERIADRTRLSITSVVAIGRQLASALNAAHTAGIIHRDLKPDNVFLVPDGAVIGGERAKILDFGIAKLADPGPGGINTHSQMILGTPRYMSPEQARAASKVDARSDIYSLGCILYELLCGRTPFDGNTGDILIHHQTTEPPPPRELMENVPPALDHLILEMLAKQPEQRPPTMQAIEDRLAPIVAMPEAPIVPAAIPKKSAKPLAPRISATTTLAEPPAAGSAAAPDLPDVVTVPRPRLAAPSRTAAERDLIARGTPNEVRREQSTIADRPRWRSPWLVTGVIGCAVAAVSIVVVLRAGEQAAFKEERLVGSGSAPIDASLPDAAVVVATNPTIAILGLEVRGQSDTEATRAAQDLTVAMRTEARAGNQLAPNSEKELVDEKLLNNCANEDKVCMAAIGAQLGASAIVYGHLERRSLGGTDGYQVSVRWVDVATRTQQSGWTDFIPGSEAAGASLVSWGRKAFRKLAGTDPPSPRDSGRDAIETRCKEAIASQDWVTVNVCGQQLTKVGGDGAGYVQRAIMEARAEVALRDMHKAITTRDFKGADARFNQIPESSVYARQAEQDFAPFKKAFVDEAVADLNRLTSDCKKWDARMRKAELDGGSLLGDAIARRAKPCIKDGVVTNPPPPNNLCDDKDQVNRIEKAGDELLAQASYPAALAQFQKIVACKGVYPKAYLAACRAKNFGAAKTYFDYIPASRKDYLAQACMKDGFDPRR